MTPPKASASKAERAFTAAAKAAVRAFTAAAKAAGWHYDAWRREYYCPHGVGHGGVHGCDGCCVKLMKAANLPTTQSPTPKLPRDQ